MLHAEPRHHSLQDLYALTEYDKKFEQDLLRLIQNKPSEITLDDVAKMDPCVLCALAETNPAINHYLDTEPRLNAQWQSLLKDLDFPDFELLSLDQRKNVSPFTQLKGVVLLEELKKLGDTSQDSTLDRLSNPNSMTILNRACELGMHDALIKRMKLNIHLLKKDKDPQSCIEKIVKDAELDMNIYWTYGCVYAGLELFALANYLHSKASVKLNNERFFQFGTHNFSWIDQYNNNKNIPAFIIIVEIAVEYFFLAMELSKHSMSQKIESVMSRSLGVFLELGKYKEIAEVEKDLMKKLDEFNIPLKESFCAKAKEKARELAQALQPTQAKSL